MTGARDWTLWIAAGSLLTSVAAVGALTRRAGWRPAPNRPDVKQVKALDRSEVDAAESYLHAWCVGRADLADALARGSAHRRLARLVRAVDGGRDEALCTRRPNLVVDETHYAEDGSVRLIGTAEGQRGQQRVTYEADLVVAPGDMGWRVRTAHLSPPLPSVRAAGHSKAAR